MAEFALFCAGAGLGVVMMTPAVLLAHALGRGEARIVWGPTGQPRVQPEQDRRERRTAEYAEVAGRG